jgi:hypothetical protein
VVKMVKLKESKNGTWLFADDEKLKGKKILAQFDDYEKRTSTTGIEFPVFRFLGSDGEFAGELLISVWRADYQPAIAAYGDDTKDWEGKMFFLSVEGAKIKVIPADEKTPA